MRTRHLLLATVAGMLAFGTALPASAETSGITDATVSVTGGSLGITVPTNAGNLGTRANTVPGGTISGPLGQVQVSDARSAIAGSGWVASAISSAFTPPTGTAIAASAVSYTAGSITKVGTADIHGEQSGRAHRSRSCGDRDRDHGRQLRHLEPNDQRAGTRRHGGRCLLSDHHPLRCLRPVAPVAAGHPAGPESRAASWPLSPSPLWWRLRRLRPSPPPAASCTGRRPRAASGCGWSTLRSAPGTILGPASTSSTTSTRGR